MKSLGPPTTRRRWFWPIQIAVGIICISLSILIFFTPQIGSYALFFLAGTGLIVLGAERIVTGIRAQKSRRKYRLINIGIGAALIAYMLPGFIFPDLVIKYLVLFLGFGLLANGALRIIDGLKRQKQEQESLTFSSLGTGIIITAVAIAVLVFPRLGLAILIIMTAVALAVSGIHVIIAGIRGSRSRSDSSMTLSRTAAEGEEYQQKQQLNRNGKSIWKNGSWFNDDQGRHLLFRGVNFASRTKLAPYLPIAPLETKNLSQLNLKQEIKSVEPELDRLKDVGFNVVRLLISWKAIEPRPNTNLDELLQEGKQYLTCIKEIINELHARNLYVFLDFHQDIAHEVYGGDGFPDWALAIDNEHKLPEPSNLKDKKWMIKYVTNKSLKKTLTSFWRNDLTNIEEEGEKKLEHFPVRTHLEKTIGQTARFFRSLNNGAGHPAILGIEPFNEPHPAGLPKEQFEQDFLVDYYRNVDLEIRKFDPDVFIFMEPNVAWTTPSSNGEGDDKSKLGLGGSGPFSARKSFNLDLVKNVMVDGEVKPIQLNTFLPKNLNSVSTFARNGVLSFHYYDMIAIASSFADSYMKIPENMYRYKREWPLIFAQLANAARERDLIPFLTEFGGFQEAEQIRDYLNLEYEQIESYLLNATHWNYDLYHTKEGKDNWNLENYSLLGPNRIPRNLDVVARPYPMRSSAEPVLLFFDIESKYATIILEGKVVEAPTVIYIPFKIHYAPEFTVWATTSKQIEWDKDNQLLYWYPEKERTLNQIIIGRGRNLDTTKLPKQAKDLASKVTLVGSFS